MSPSGEPPVASPEGSHLPAGRPAPHPARIPDDLDPELAEVLSDPEVVEALRDPETRRELRACFRYHFSGPLPPPGTLAAYERVCPGLADRITRMAEDEGTHRRTMESVSVHADISLAYRGQWFAFILALAVVSLGTWLIYSGRDVLGLAMIVGSLGTLLTVFILGRKAKQGEAPKAEPKSEPQKAEDAQLALDVSE